MRYLIDAFPDIDVMLALTPEELAAKLLFLIRNHEGGQFVLGNLMSGLMPSLTANSQSLYPPGKISDISLAIREAWAWLEVQGLIIAAEGMNGQNGWKVFSRRACSFENPAAFADYTAAKRLPREMLHRDLTNEVWQSFMRGAYATAVFEAMRAVEISVRTAASFPRGDHGVPMIRRAFHKDNGPLTDPTAEESEKEALSNLFAGAIGSYKNPHSHRRVPLEDPVEAAEIVLLASHLLRIVDARAQDING